MSFQSLRASRNKKQTKSFVTDPAQSGVVLNNPSDNPPSPSPENPELRYDLPTSMEIKVVPGKGRAVFSTAGSKPGLVSIH